MHLPPWFWLAGVALVLWGVVGLFQKLCTNYISAESALICAAAGWLFLLVWLYPGSSMWSAYSHRNMGWGVLSGTLNALAAWMLFSAMRRGGKASVVVPFTALYPLVVVVFGPWLLHESLTLRQSLGVVGSIIAVVLLTRE